MKETLRHAEAFDYYYSLSDKRSLIKVAEHTGCALRTISNWSKQHTWRSRVQQRDIDNSRRLEKKTDNHIINARAMYREQIGNTMKLVKAALATAIEELTNKTLKVKSMADITSLVGSYDKLVRLDLDKLGDPDTGREFNVTFRVVRTSERGDDPALQIKQISASSVPIEQESEVENV